MLLEYFLWQEVESILSMYKIPHTWIEKPAENVDLINLEILFECCTNKFLIFRSPGWWFPCQMKNVLRNLWEDLSWFDHVLNYGEDLKPKITLMNS